MKTKLKQEYRQKTKEEIISALEKKRRELVETRFKINQGKIKDTRMTVKLGDEIAVLENILKEKVKEEGLSSFGQKKKPRIDRGGQEKLGKAEETENKKEKKDKLKIKDKKRETKRVSRGKK